MRLHPIVLMAGLLMATAASAYDKAGHFYSAEDMLAHAMPGYPKEAETIAFCVQLPDEASEIDAAEQAFHALKSEKFGYLSWGVFNQWKGKPAIEQMILVQRLLHVLVGGRNPPAVQAAAIANVHTLALQARAALGTPGQNVSLCAAGLALHALGDSFAHVDMDDVNQMYPTGRGHAVHAHYPDYPLCETFNGFIDFSHHCRVAKGWDEPRAKGWAKYFDVVHREFSAAFAGPGAAATDATGAFIAALRQQDCATDGDHWCENQIREGAAKDMGDVATSPSVTALGVALGKHDPSSCRDALLLGWSGGPASPLPMPAPTCTEVFQRYRSIALPTILPLTDGIPLGELSCPDFNEAGAGSSSKNHCPPLTGP